MNSEQPWTLQEVRDRVLLDHAAIRERFTSIATCARGVLLGETSSLSELQDAIWDLFVFFEQHLSLEEAHLAPILHYVDSWGPFRVDHMREEHAEQRKLLRNMVLESAWNTMDAKGLASEATRLIKILQRDMANEEHDLIALRDDGFDEAPMSG